MKRAFETAECEASPSQQCHITEDWISVTVECM